MSITWPWNVHLIGGVIPVAVIPGETPHEYVRRLVDERYGTDASLAITGLEVDGDQGAISAVVRMPPTAEHVQINIVPIRTPGP